MVGDIKEFLNLNEEDVLLEEHKKLINNYILNCNMLQKDCSGTMVMETATTKFGTHYTSCVWSHEDVEEGPDTCLCSQLSMMHDRIAKLRKLYARILNK